MARKKQDAVGQAQKNGADAALLAKPLPGADLVRAAASAAEGAPLAPPFDAENRARVFQIYYEPWQRDLVDPDFVPLENPGKPTEYLEFDLFERLSISSHVEGAALWGALSWRFTEKTGLTGAAFRDVLTLNPGFDVYYCNALPQHEALYHNLWLQGETAHPEFLELVEAWLAAAELPTDDTRVIVPSTLYSTANYFVGTPAFWSAYLPFVRGAIRRADARLPEAIRDKLHSTAADDRNLHGGSTYMPFIVERLFPLFMRLAGSELKGFKIPLPIPEEDINVHLRLLREMKDTAWRTKSQWLAACWVNYRNLYLTQHHGQDWARKYLRRVTPGEIKFG